jgi:hypothetical protein
VAVPRRAARPELRHRPWLHVIEPYTQMTRCPRWGTRCSRRTPQPEAWGSGSRVISRRATVAPLAIPVPSKTHRNEAKAERSRCAPTRLRAPRSSSRLGRGAVWRVGTRRDSGQARRGLAGRSVSPRMASSTSATPPPEVRGLSGGRTRDRLGVQCRRVVRH